MGIIHKTALDTDFFFLTLRRLRIVFNSSAGSSFFDGYHPTIERLAKPFATRYMDFESEDVEQSVREFLEGILL